MGKKGGSSWLTAVKRAFRSPTKDSQKKSSRRREENDHEPDEEEKKREKRRWLFRKPAHNNAVQNEPNSTVRHSELLPPDQRHAIAVAAATAAAAEAAAATAQAAVEIIRLTRSSNPRPTCLKHNCSAIIIQTAFRGYLARRALVALRGIVKLQALIRGQNVRKQAKMTLRCMQALLRLQTRMHECHQATRRLSQDGSLGIGGGRKFMFAHSNNCCSDHPNYLGDILQDSKSMSKDRRSSNMSTDWSECPSTLEELEAALQARNEAIAFKRETSLAHAFSQKMWNPDTQGMNTGERSNWLDQWMATKQWNDSLSNKGRVSTDKRDSSSFIKTVEMDMLPKQYSASANVRKFQHPSASPGRYRSTNSMVQPPPPTTPSPPPSKLKQARPHHNKDDKSSYSAANTPSLRFNSSSIITRFGNAANYHHVSNNNANDASGMPNYMAATESAKARLRSQSAPRQRPATPERERGGLLSSSSSSSAAKKRLSFPAVPPEGATSNNCMSYNEYLRSPSFKSLQAGGCYLGLDQQSNQSCYTDSIATDISPSSTTDLRRWLR